MQVFILECERRKILTPQILKSLNNKILRFINQKVDYGLLHALARFLQTGSRAGAALDSVVFCQNNFTDQQFSTLL